MRIQSFVHESDDDDDDWIPLLEEDNNDVPSTNKDDSQKASSSFQLNSSAENKYGIRSSSASGSSYAKTYEKESIETIQARLESRIKLREGLVNHPLQEFGRAFCKHLVHQLWTGNIRIRLGVAFILVGLFLHILRGLSHIKVLFYVSLLLLGVGYLFRWDRYFSSKSLDLDIIHAVTDDIRSFRFLFLCFLFLPTFVEVQTYIYFARTIVFQSGNHKFLQILLVLLVQSSFLYYLKSKMKLSSMKCNRYGRLMLQSLAFLYSVRNWRNLHLGGPFFFLLGGYLLTSVCEDENGHEIDEMEWANRVIRLCLRLTLRDVLSDLGDNVAEDEMLQLAMLRWIVDYWAYRKISLSGKDSSSGSTSTSSTKSTGRATAPSGPTISTPTNMKKSDVQQKTANKDDKSEAPEKTPPLSVATSHGRDFSPVDLNWEDLSQMLSTTTGLMENEVNMNSNDSAIPTTTPFGTHTSTQTTSDGSIDNLRSLLSSIDVDNRAKHAIKAYKLAIQSFPPSNQICEILSIIKKCPASIAAVLLQSYGGEQLLLESFLLIPSIYVEVTRLLTWRKSIIQLECYPTINSGNDSNPPSDVYGMTILLTTHTDSPHCTLPNRPPTLLQVWLNILNSVTVFEQGLQGVKCAQTSIVAKDFCNNVVSLAGLGVQVYNKGLVYGIGVIAQDLLSNEIHMRDEDGLINLKKGRYVKDALGVVNNGSFVLKNMNEILEENDRLLGPIIEASLGAFGKGWLWGKTSNEEEELDEHTNEKTTTKDKNEDGHISVILQSAIQETIELNKTIKDGEEEDLHNQSLRSNDKESNSTNDYGRKSKMDKVSLLNDAIKETLRLNNDIQERKREKSLLNVEKEDDLASLLSLISEALEKDLIAEVEKNQIMEVILKSKTSDVMNEKNILESIARSLRHSLQDSSSHLDLANMKNKQNEIFGDTIDNSIVVTDQVQVKTGRTIFIDENKASEETNSESKLKKKEEHNEKPQTFWAKDLELTSETETCQTGDNHNERDEDEIDDEKSWTKISSEPIVTETTKEFDSNIKNDQERELQSIQKENDDNLLQKIGGGLTMLGAVVGGLAIIANNNANDESEQKTKDVSSVIIEELEDDQE